MKLHLKNERRLTTMADALFAAARKAGALKVDHGGHVLGMGTVGAGMAKAMSCKGLSGTVPSGITANMSYTGVGARAAARMFKGD